MAKKVIKKLKVMAPAGKATPAPPLGSTLGQAGINIGQFVTEFNDRTREMAGDIIPVEVSIYEDRSFDFLLKTPPASKLILKAIGKEKGSGKNLISKAGTITKDQVREIAKQKAVDLTSNDDEAGMKMVEGTARSMGVEVK